MKPFTSKHCAQYLTKASPFNQEDDKKKKEKKDDTFKYLKGFVSSAERSKKDNTKTSTEDFYKRKRELEAKNSAPTNYNKKTEKLKKKISETEKKAFIRSNSTFEDYETSPGEIRAQRRLKRLKRKLKRKEQK